MNHILPDTWECESMAKAAGARSWMRTTWSGPAPTAAALFEALEMQVYLRALARTCDLVAYRVDEVEWLPGTGTVTAFGPTAVTRWTISFIIQNAHARVIPETDALTPEGGRSAVIVTLL